MGSRDARPIMFHHGWPLSSDDGDAQMLFFLGNGYRVIAGDRHLRPVRRAAAAWPRRSSSRPFPR